MTPKEQYKFYKKGDQAINEKIPSMHIATKTTMAIPHNTKKSFFVSIAYAVNPRTIARVMQAAITTTWLPFS